MTKPYEPPTFEKVKDWRAKLLRACEKIETLPPSEFQTALVTLVSDVSHEMQGTLMDYDKYEWRTPEQCSDLVAEVKRLREELRQARDWEDVKDEWSKEIRSAHPARSDSHEEYGVAMQMVGHRHSKGELVALVNWLLVRLRDLRRDDPRSAHYASLLVPGMEPCSQCGAAIPCLAGAGPWHEQTCTLHRATET